MHDDASFGFPIVHAPRSRPTAPPGSPRWLRSPRTSARWVCLST